MQSWIRVVLWCFALMVYSSPAGWGQSMDYMDYKVYCLGEEINLSLKTKTGRVYGLKTELLKLAEEFFPESYQPGDGDSQWVPLRAFWEEIGLAVKWVPDVKAIIMSDKTNHIDVPEEAQEIMEKAFADTYWLSINLEQQLQAHLSQFYTPELVEEILFDAWRFLQLETDWHNLYQLVDSQGLDGGEDWLLVKVTVSEIISSEEELSLMKGIVKLRELDAGWRIDAHYFFD